MPSSPAQIVDKLWNYCHVLQDDGLSYGDELKVHYHPTLRRCSV